MTKKRILMVLEGEFPPDIRVEKEALSLIEEGFEVHICSFNFSDKPAYEEINGMHIHRMSIPKQFFKKLPVLMNLIPLYQRIWYSFLNKIMRQINYDAIHVHDLPLCGIGVKLAAKYNIPLIADMHENYPYLIKGSLFMKYRLVKYIVNFNKWLKNESEWLTAADFVITTSEGMKRRLVNSGIADSKIYILENTINKTADVPAEYQNDPDKLIIIYVGGISDDRGLQYAIRGFQLAALEEKKLQFWIVGDGSYRKHLEKIVSDNKIAGITFWGWKNRADTDELLMRADIGIIPHIKSVQNDNTSPNKIFEYFLFGKPVIVSNCDYLVNLMEESGAGVHYEYNSPQSLSESLLSLLQKDLKATGLKGRAILDQKYNWENTKTSLLDLYHHIK